MTVLQPIESEQPRRRADLTVWLCDLTYTDPAIAAELIPNAIGGIATFTETQVELPALIRLYKYPEKLIAELERDGFPDVIGFSNYVWNSALSYALAAAIKRHSPKTVVVFGGPNYPSQASEQEAFFKARPAVDFYIIKEGEVPFANLIAAIAEHGGDLDAVKRLGLPSVHALCADGTPVLPTTAERLRDLTAIPSPYVTGRLDEFFDGKLLPIIQTNRGCPFSCTYCVEGTRYYNKVYRNSVDKLTQELEHISARMAEARAKGGRNDLFIADSNFAMYAEDIDVCHAIADVKARTGWPEYINVATGKNKKERVLEASRILGGGLRLAGSVQSLDPTVLENIQRANISADILMDLALKASEVNANSYSEVILGLPGETLDSHLGTLRTVINAGFTYVVPYQLMLLMGSEMGSREHRERFGMKVHFRVLPRCFGRYTLKGQEIRVAEIEEICTGTETLSFADYLESRRFHLLVAIFYNDSVFSILTKMLRQAGVELYRWLHLLSEMEVSPGLRALLDNFAAETRDELWEKRDDLAAFIQQDGVVGRYQGGELGRNLIFWYKTLSMTECMDELAGAARVATLACLDEADAATPERVRFVEEAVLFHALRLRNTFHQLDDVPTATLTYDFGRYEADVVPGPIADYRLAAPTEVSFVLDEQQKQRMLNFRRLFGDTVYGRVRTVQRAFVRKLFRQPRLASS